MNRRRDYKTALLIDAVIYSDAPDIRAHAASGLSEQPLPPEVATRIFMEPAGRRRNRLAHDAASGQ